MKKILLSIIALATLGFGAIAQTSYNVGDVIPNFTVTDTEGNTQDLYAITATGKYVYIDFFFDTCGPCQSVSPTYNEFYDKYGCNSGDVYCLTMNNGSDNDAEVIAYEQTYGGSFNHAPAVSADGGAGAVNTAFGIGAFPTVVLIGPDNKLIEQDIFPISSVATLEGTFPTGFSPSPMACSFAGVVTNKLEELTVYPNPSSDNVNISFSSSDATDVEVSIFNLLGEKIKTINTTSSIGSNNININVNDFTVGQYIIQIQKNNKLTTTKFTVSK